MGFWQIDTDTLANGRFVVSPLAETLACLHTLYHGTQVHPAERTWLDAQPPAASARLVAADPLTGPRSYAAMRLRTHWIADLPTPVPFDGRAGLPGGSWRRIQADAAGPGARRPGGVVRRPAARACSTASDLAGRTGGRPDLGMDRNRGAPTWERRRRIMEADVVARTAQLSRNGWAAALNDMRPGMRWLGDGRLQINVHDFPPEARRTGALYFAPVTPARGWVAWDDTPRYAIVYPCSGVLADVDAATLPQPLARLLGTNRALILVLLDAPKSTTQLVALTDQPLGSVGRHLRILLDAGLVRRRRSGKSVLYYRTVGGDVLVEGASRRRES